MALRIGSRSFNSRTPCGVRRKAEAVNDYRALFQFTHPVRGATARLAIYTASSQCFNSRTPCGVRLPERGAGNQAHAVSIHAPRAGCDTQDYLQQVLSAKFQFTHPVRGATRAHFCSTSMEACFNSRTPCGVRLLPTFVTDSPMRVSIHAPRAGCDLWTLTADWTTYKFQFTHPVRGATLYSLMLQ